MDLRNKYLFVLISCAFFSIVLVGQSDNLKIYCLNDNIFDSINGLNKVDSFPEKNFDYLVLKSENEKSVLCSGRVENGLKIEETFFLHNIIKKNSIYFPDNLTKKEYFFSTKGELKEILVTKGRVRILQQKIGSDGRLNMEFSRTNNLYLESTFDSLGHVIRIDSLKQDTIVGINTLLSSTKYCSNGQLSVYLTYVSSGIRGFVERHCNGSIKIQANYLNNDISNLIGDYFEFYDNGILKVKGKYEINDKKTNLSRKVGKWIYYYSNGKVQEIKKY